jgi:hypothetical protein
MKKIGFVFLLAFVTLYATAQQSQTRNIGTFTGVKASEGIDVYLNKGDKESVKVVVNGGNISLNDVITEVGGSYLKIHLRDSDRGYRNIDVKVYVTYVTLEKLSVSSAGSIFAEGTIKSNNMELSASSAGTIEIGVETNDLEASASSAGEIELRGKARSIDVDASSAGEIDAYDLEAENVTAKALTAHASSGGGIRYRGNPDKSVTNSSSGGSVKKSN